MMKNWKRILALLLSFTYFFQITAAVAVTSIPTPIASTTPTTTSANNVIDSEATSDPYSAIIANSLQNLSFNSDSLGLSGPLSMGVNYDTLFDTIFNAKWAQKIGDSSAVGLIGEYGPNQYRLNGTAGFQPYPDGAFKLTAEYLSQVLPFSFDSGDIEQRVSQSAYGFRLQHNLNQAAFQNVNFGGYWAQAPNTSLSTLTFIGDDGFMYVNQRNLAGATSQGLDASSRILFSPRTSLDATVYYDSVVYDTQFTSDSSYDDQGVGGGLKINQLIGNRMIASADVSARALYNTFGAELTFVPEFGAPLGMNITLMAQRLISSNQAPDSNTFGLQLGFLSDEGGKAPNYQLGGNSSTPDLGEWVKDPAVYMERVLVVSEQVTTLQAPMVLEIDPSSGPFVGGNTVIIRGTNFLPGIIVTFAGVPGIVTLISSTELSVIVPELPLPPTAARTTAPTITEAVDIVLLNPNGQRTVWTGSYTYTTEFLPTVADIAPSSGTTAGETSVTLTGTNLTGTTSLTFDGLAANDVIVVNDTTVTALTPAHDAGDVDVVLTTPNGDVNVPNGYTYVTPAPTLTSLAPTSGTTDGSTSVTITGTHLTGTTAVTFGGSSVSFASIHVINDTTVTVSTPSHTAGIVDVILITPAGTSNTLTGAYTYATPAPTLTSLTPTSGTTDGGTSVTITGTHLTGTTAVTFGGSSVSFASIHVINDTTVTVSTPSHTAGIVDVILITPAGTSNTLTGAYTYVTPAPTLTSLTPTSGPNTGGTTVTLTGTHLTGTTSVTFGSSLATAVTVVNDTTVTARTPVHAAAGAVNVILTTPAGISNTLTSAYTYVTLHIIYVTSTNSDGNLGGFTGANTKCNATGSGKPTSGFAAGYTYKALLNGNNATVSGTDYYRISGTPKIATANGGNLVGSANLDAPISVAVSSNVWTGENSSNNCVSWSSNNSSFTGSSGVSNSSTSAYWSANTSICTTNTQKLYCVSQ